MRRSLKRELVSAQLGDFLKNRNRFIRYFGADAIAGDYQDLQLHSCLLFFES